MKLMKRTGLYQSSNLSFDPKKIEAVSYRWWAFVRVIEGVIVVNDYRYSVTTAKHQGKVRQLMRELGIVAGVVGKCSASLSQFDSLAEVFKVMEETACDDFLREERKKIERNEKAAKRRELDRDRAMTANENFQGLELVANEGNGN